MNEYITLVRLEKLKFLKLIKIVLKNLNIL